MDRWCVLRRQSLAPVAPLRLPSSSAGTQLSLPRACSARLPSSAPRRRPCPPATAGPVVGVCAGPDDRGRRRREGVRRAGCGWTRVCRHRLDLHVAGAAPQRGDARRGHQEARPGQVHRQHQDRRRPEAVAAIRAGRGRVARAAQRVAGAPRRQPRRPAHSEPVRWGPGTAHTVEPALVATS